MNPPGAMGATEARLRRFAALYRLVTRPHVGRHPGQVALLVAAVALGVSAIVASGNLIETAIASLEQGWQVGDVAADLRIANGFAGVPESLLATVADMPGVESASGVLQTRARARLDDGTVDLQIFAFDLFGDDPIHRAGLRAEDIEFEDESLFLTRPEAVVLDRGFAAAHGLALGESFPVDLGTGRRELLVAGLLEPSPASAVFGGALAVMDLPAAQHVLGREGMLESVAVKVAPGADVEAVRAALSAAVAGRATVTPPGARSSELRSLLSSIRLILGVPGWIAIVVGALVVYHAVSVAVSRRKAELDVIRSLGATRRSLVALLSVEGIATGLVGSALGVGLGTGLAELASGVLRQTVSEIYLPLTTVSPRMSWTFVAIGVGLGVLVTWGSFVGPGRSATRITSGLFFASPREERWRIARHRAWLGVLLVPCGVLLGIVQQAGMSGEGLAAVASSGDAVVLFGLGLLVPVAVLAASPWISRRLRSSRAVLARLGWQGFTQDPARGATVVTSVMIGAAYVMITVGSVGSLREGIVGWVDQSQTADLVVAGPGSMGLFPGSNPIRGELESVIEAQPGVLRVEPLRVTTQPYRDRWIVVAARNPEALGDVYPVTVVSGDLAAAKQAMVAGTGVVASKHFAVQHRQAQGDTIELRSPSGPVRFRIDAIVEDFNGADLGAVFVSPETLRSRWGDRDVTSFSVWLDDPSHADTARDALDQALRGQCDCSVLTRSQYRDRTSGVIDGMFYTAYALEAVASLVLIIAVASFFFIVMSERRRELGLLRDLGATRRQILGSLLWEASAVGLLGGALGCAVGALLAYRMVKTTIRLGGGFTLDFVLPADTVVTTVLAATAICVTTALLTVGPSLRRRDAGAGSEAWE